MLIPRGTTLLHSQDLVPGCAVAATIRRTNSTYRLVSVYLPPSRKAETIEAIRQAIGRWDDTPTYWGGDVNIQIDNPRDGETDEAAALSDL
eukprot:8791089-Pyramimonas_sp.AAC.1